MVYTFATNKKPTFVVRRCCGKSGKREFTLVKDV